MFSHKRYFTQPTFLFLLHSNFFLTPKRKTKKNLFSDTPLIEFLGPASKIWNVPKKNEPFFFLLVCKTGWDKSHSRKRCKIRHHSVKHVENAPIMKIFHWNFLHWGGWRKAVWKNVNIFSTTRTFENYSCYDWVAGTEESWK